MEDDVLLAIFIILYENDNDCQGMTVKQICDILVEKHPDMSKLSSKTSNLVSAKLNAYVKKVEKGDASIHYALSRDWADSSPKRMVYVYRGILSPEYPAYVMKIIEEHREREAMNDSASLNANPDNTPIERVEFEADMNDSTLVYTSKLKADLLGKVDGRTSSSSSLSQSLSSLHSVSPAGLQLNKVSPFGNGTIDFGISQLSVPYDVAPVTASLNISMPVKPDEETNRILSTTSDFSLRKGNEFLPTIPDSDDEYSLLKGDFDDDNDADDDESSIYENHAWLLQAWI